MNARILLPPGWSRPRGYSNGVATRGRMVFTSGIVGWDTEGVFAQGFAAQCAQAFANIAAILAEGGARAEHVVRLTWYVTDRAAYVAEAKAIGVAYRAVFGDHYPAMAVIEVSALVEEAALVEIEATAVVPD